MAGILKDELAILNAAVTAAERGRQGLLEEIAEAHKEIAEAHQAGGRLIVRFNALRDNAVSLEAKLRKTRQYVKREKVARLRQEILYKDLTTRLSFLLGQSLLARRRGLDRLKVVAAPVLAYREYKKARLLFEKQRRELEAELAELIDKPANTRPPAVAKRHPKFRSAMLRKRAKPNFADLDTVHTPFLEQHRSALSIVGARHPRTSDFDSQVFCYGLHNSLPYSSGGYATRAQGIMIGMAQRGMKGIGFTRPGFPAEAKPDLDPASIPAVDIIEGIEYRRTLLPRRKGTPIEDYVREGAEAVRPMLEAAKPRVVIAASNYITGLVFLAAARRMGVPFIYEVRGFWEITKLSRFPNVAEHESFAINRMMEAQVCRMADRVATLTAAMRDELVSRGVPSGKIDIVPNCTNLDSFVPRPRDQELAARLGIGPSSVVIGYVGTFVDYEGLENLVEACARLVGENLDFRVLLVGNENTSGTEKGAITEAIERIVEASGLQTRIIMPGRVPHDEVARYYSLIDIAPFPRRAWPVCEMVSPMKPMEAMAMEKAVLVSSVGALAEMVDDGQTGLIFEKENMDDLAAKLRLLIGDPALRQRLGRQSRQWVQETRQWKHSAARMIECIEAAEQTYEALTT